MSLALHSCTLAKDEDTFRAIAKRHGDQIPYENELGEKQLQRILAGTGPGSQMWRLLESLGIRHTASCSCLNLAETMNRLGPSGCRRDREQLLAAMRHNAKSYGWTAVATAAARAVTTGIVWRLKLTDVYGSLLDEAIRRAEESEISNLTSQIAAPITDPPLDILIPVGRGSQHDDLELRFALRSIQRYARGVRRVWIVGQIPPWLCETDQVRLVPRDEAQGNKAYRIAAKVEWACRELDLTDTFAFWNDDYLLTQDLDLRTIPPWYHGELFRGEESEGWQRLLSQTGAALQGAGLPAKHYDIHVPMLIERQKFLAAGAWWQNSAATALTMKSVYGNLYCDATAVPYSDAKLAGQWRDRIDHVAASRPVLSYGNEALQTGFGDWLAGCFPDAHPAEQIVIAVLGQFRGGTSCVAGVLHALGVSMGSGWPSPHRNPRGTYEDRRLAKLCRRAFREPLLTEQIRPKRRINKLRRWAAQRGGHVIGAKHPSLCLCVPQLVRAWPAVRFVAVYRPAVDSIRSMAQAMWSWTPAEADRGTRRLIATRDADLAVCRRPVMRVAYDELLRDPETIVRALARFGGLTPDAHQCAEAVATVDPRLRTVSTA